jgi:hypothetical protein
VPTANRIARKYVLIPVGDRDSIKSTSKYIYSNISSIMASHAFKIRQNAILPMASLPRFHEDKSKSNPNWMHYLPYSCTANIGPCFTNMHEVCVNLFLTK